MSKREGKKANLLTYVRNMAMEQFLSARESDEDEREEEREVVLE